MTLLPRGMVGVTVSCALLNEPAKYEMIGAMMSWDLASIASRRLLRVYSPQLECTFGYARLVPWFVSCV
jgi:hypothetical protein